MDGLRRVHPGLPSTLFARTLYFSNKVQGLFDENRPGCILLRPDLYSLQEIQLEEI